MHPQSGRPDTGSNAGNESFAISGGALLIALLARGSHTVDEKIVFYASTPAQVI